MEYVSGYKYRLCPTNKQKQAINQVLGCYRFVFNHFLAERSDAWKKNQESVTYLKTAKMLTELKRNPKFVWLNAVDSMALQESLRDLDRAFQNFFVKRSGYPKFKSKHNRSQSYRTRNQSQGIRIDGNKVKLPKIGWVKFKNSRNFDGKILNATISKTTTGKYFVSFCVEQDIAPLLKRNQGGEVGIDVGLKEFYSDSNGQNVNNPRILAKMSKKLTREQRKLSRKVKGSKNREKVRLRVARVHERIANIRHDFLHKESLKLVRENQVIGIEGLQVKNMMKNHKLAKAISDVSWSEFFRMLKYKAVLHGSQIVEVPTFYPSSQTCHVCGYKNPITKNLAVREWQCPNCNTQHDRDINAAQNILSKAKEILAEESAA